MTFCWRSYNWRLFSWRPISGRPSTAITLPEYIFRKQRWQVFFQVPYLWTIRWASAIIWVPLYFAVDHTIAIRWLQSVIWLQSQPRLLQQVTLLIIAAIYWKIIEMNNILATASEILAKSHSVAVTRDILAISDSIAITCEIVATSHIMPIIWVYWNHDRNIAIISLLVLYKQSHYCNNPWYYCRKLH